MNEWPYVVWLDEEDRPLKQISRAPEELAEALQWCAIRDAMGNTMQNMAGYVLIADLEMGRLVRDVESVTVSNVSALGGSVSGSIANIESKVHGAYKNMRDTYEVEIVPAARGRVRSWELFVSGVLGQRSW